MPSKSTFLSIVRSMDGTTQESGLRSHGKNPIWVGFIKSHELILRYKYTEPKDMLHFLNNYYLGKHCYIYSKAITIHNRYLMKYT